VDVKPNDKEWARDRLQTAVELVDEIISGTAFNDTSIKASVGRLTTMAHEPHDTAAFYAFLAMLMERGSSVPPGPARNAYFTVLNLVNTGLVAAKEEIRAKLAQ
jgi:hypothetical protein